MVAVTEDELYAARLVTLMSSVDTIDTAKFTPTAAPAVEASATAFPNGRSEKFFDLNGSSQYWSSNLSLYVPNLNQVIVSIWIKPDFAQTYGAHRGVYDGYAPNNGHYLAFNYAQDDWATGTSNISGNVFYTVGETWSADNVIHMVNLCSCTGALDSGKAQTIYINNVQKTSTTSTSYTAGTVFANPTLVGRSVGAGYGYFDGGIYDFAVFDYAALSATHTDAEIVQALYSNTFNSGVHKFSYELTTSYVPSEGLSIVGRKTRIISGATPATVLETDGVGVNYLKYSFRTVTAAYTVDSLGYKDFVIRASGTTTITLPSAATYPGRVIIIKNVGTNTVTSNGLGMDPGYAVTWFSNGSTWETLSIGATLA